jgi:cell division ATPase FtsA
VFTKNYLDDVELGNLEGQKGKKTGVEIVAAFLPKMVLESLKYVVEDNGIF